MEKIVRFHQGDPLWKIEMLWNAYINTTDGFKKASWVMVLLPEYLSPMVTSRSTLGIIPPRLLFGVKLVAILFWHPVSIVFEKYVHFVFFASTIWRRPACVWWETFPTPRRWLRMLENLPPLLITIAYTVWPTSHKLCSSWNTLVLSKDSDVFITKRTSQITLKSIH